jgi:hypothetical protein
MSSYKKSSGKTASKTARKREEAEEEIKNKLYEMMYGNSDRFGRWHPRGPKRLGIVHAQGPWSDYNDQGPRSDTLPPADTSTLDELIEKLSDRYVHGPWYSFWVEELSEEQGKVRRKDREIDEINRDIIASDNRLQYLRGDFLNIEYLLNLLEMIENGKLSGEHLEGTIEDKRRSLRDRLTMVNNMIQEVEEGIKIQQKEIDKRMKRTGSNGGANKTRKANKIRKAKKTRRAHKK